MTECVVDLYLARGRIRATIAMLGFRRLEEVFNNAPNDFIAATTRLTTMGHSGSDQSGRSIEARELVVRLRDVRLVRPLDAPELPRTSAWRERLPTRVVMDLDDWQVTGNVHLVDRVRWLDFMAGARHRFLSITNASVRFVGVGEPLECEFLLVNGARVSALYEEV